MRTQITQHATSTMSHVCERVFRASNYIIIYLICIQQWIWKSWTKNLSVINDATRIELGASVVGQLSKFYLVVVTIELVSIARERCSLFRGGGAIHTTPQGRKMFV